MRDLAAVPCLLGLAVTAGVSCSYPPLSQRGVEVKDTAITANPDLDLLFVIDDSLSMGDKQRRLITAFPEFVNGLQLAQGGLPNLHIGVVTSDLGSKGAADEAPGPAVGAIGRGGCVGLGKGGALQTFGAPVTAAFLSDVRDSSKMDGTRLTNYDGTLAEVFGVMASAGELNCGFEQSLEAIRQALGDNAMNAGFLRPEAHLGVIVLTDEDDCSFAHSTLLDASSEALEVLGPLQSFRCTRFGVVCDEGGATSDAMNEIGPKRGCRPNDSSEYLTKVSDIADFLKGLKSDPRRIFVAGIMGPTEPFATDLREPPAGGPPIPTITPSCTYVAGDGTPQEGDPAIRIQSFLDQFPDRNASVPICEDLSGGLRQIADRLRMMIDNTCFESKLADVDGKTPGPQYGCTVTVVTSSMTDGSEGELARCTPEDASATNLPCWRLERDAATCPLSEHIAFKIEGRAMLPSDARVIAECITEIDD